jgi:aerobic-type carbon monoxide dehydrogenase small subunit (CoxS/CutS family)
MIAAQLGRGQRVPDSLEIVEGEDGARTILVDGEEVENCSVM